MWFQLVGAQVLHIARKHDGIGIQVVHHIDSPLHHPLAGTLESTHMGIRELYDAIAVEGFGQVTADILHLTDLQLLETDEDAIGDGTP